MTARRGRRFGRGIAMCGALIAWSVGTSGRSCARDAAADAPKLTLDRDPPPRHLRMRPRSAAVTPPEPAATTATPTPPPPVAPAPDHRPDDAGDDAVALRDVREPVSARINLGYVVDGTAPTDRLTLSGKPAATPDGSPTFATSRAYGFGEGSLSTRGVGLTSLSSYFASQFQLTRKQVAFDPNATPTTFNLSPPIATWFERSGIEPRAAWLEMSDFLPDHRLAPLRVRAGELYVYGPWVLHMYGLVGAWDGSIASATVYGGSRVPDYTLTDTAAKDRAGIGGATIKIDLGKLHDPIPIAIAAEALGFTAAGANQASRHTQVELSWRPRRDLALIGQARTLAGDLASEHVQFRSRYKQVTNFVIDLTHRHRTDWLWDPSVTQPDPMAPRRYLDLGPVLPQLFLSARAGTLIAENVDVYARGALASDLVSDDTKRSTYAASYVELGGAVELRLRRTIALGASALTRQTQRTDLGQISDSAGPQVLPAQSSPSLGEKGFTEIGTSVRMSLGARKFSALLEVYGRRTNYALDYCVETKCPMSQLTGQDTGIRTNEIRGGGRFTVDAWIGKRLRLFASYDLSSQLAFAPEITGYKSLRLMMEGVY